jgi:hypothetical protein
MDPGGQVASIDGNGNVRVVRYSLEGRPEQVLAAGHVQPSRIYRMALAVIGARLIFTVNGEEAASVTDSRYTSSKYVLITMHGGRNASATFSDFEYSLFAPPLPLCSVGEA